MLERLICIDNDPVEKDVAWLEGGLVAWLEGGLVAWLEGGLAAYSFDERHKLDHFYKNSLSKVSVRGGGSGRARAPSAPWLIRHWVWQTNIDHWYSKW